MAIFGRSYVAPLSLRLEQTNSSTRGNLCDCKVKYCSLRTRIGRISQVCFVFGAKAGFLNAM